MSTEPIAINRYLGTSGICELNEVVASAYREIAELREVPIPDGLTAWDVADAILDTLSGQASSGFDLKASELVGFVRTAVDQLTDEE